MRIAWIAALALAIGCGSGSPPRSTPTVTPPATPTSSSTATVSAPPSPTPTPTTTQTPTTGIPIGLAALTDLAALAELRPPGMRVAQVSSYDRSGGNHDLGVGPDTTELLGIDPVLIDNSYLYREGDRYVVFDDLGPGVVYRIWMTGLDAALLGELGGDIAFALDDEPSPRLRLTRTELFSGQSPPFLPPLAGDAQVSSGGFYSLVPIAYARRLRITTSVVPNWLQITYAQLPIDRQIESFDPAADVGDAAARLAATGADPKRIAPMIDSEVALAVPPGEEQMAWQFDAPGTVLGVELFAPPGAGIPLDVRLQAVWDAALVPQVDTPLDDLFGAALGDAARAYAIGRAGDRFYCYFAMPFRQRARIAVRNDGAEPFEGWRMRVTAVDRVLPAQPAYFHARANRARLTRNAPAYVLLDTPGTGHVVGVVLTSGCARGDACQVPWFDGSHLEGDEHIAVDGSRYPQIHGTGLEDFFNGAFYFNDGPFTLPTHGNPTQAMRSARRPGMNLRSAYRLLLGDAIPFYDGVRLAIEHGPTNQSPADMSSVVFYYAIPESTLIETDRIDIGVAESEAGHAFSAADRLDRTLTSAFRGESSTEPFTAAGLEATRTRFRITVDPANRGVRLRRLADIGAGRQSAALRVDGRPAGTWYTAAVNPLLRWAELDFDLPASLTAGRRTLDIELDATDSPTPWTAFSYSIFEYRDP